MVVAFMKSLKMYFERVDPAGVMSSQTGALEYVLGVLGERDGWCDYESRHNCWSPSMVGLPRSL